VPQEPFFVMSASCFGMAVVYPCLAQAINVSLITASIFMHVLVARISLYSNKSLSFITTLAILETRALLYSKHRNLAAFFWIIACPPASLCCDLHITGDNSSQ